MTSFVATAGAVETLDDTFLVVLAETEDGRNSHRVSEGFDLRRTGQGAGHGHVLPVHRDGDALRRSSVVAGQRGLPAPIIETRQRPRRCGSTARFLLRCGCLRRRSVRSLPELNAR